MKVILYMAITANGMIAKENDDTSWISKMEWDSYSAMVRNAGHLVIGHRTYNILTRQPEFKEFEKVKIVVVAHKDFKTLAAHHLVAHSPREALELFKDVNTVIVAGGGILDSSFMTENLVDEMYLDIEPTLLGRGIPLFRESNFETRLKLLDIKKLSEDEIQLHYKVIK